MKKNILLYDDEEKFSKTVEKELNKIEAVSNVFNILRMDDDDFEKELNALENRRKSYRNEVDPNIESNLDKSSVFIIDYDLLKYSKSQYLTGENVAYLARCYSKCQFIIGLNQFNREQNFFDLTLKGHPESYCDLNLTSPQLYNKGLWSNEKEQFRPWYWPQIPKYIESMAKRFDETKKKFCDSIIKTLNLESSFNYLSKPAIEFLGPEPEKVTFEEFAISSGKGLRPKDLNSDKDVLVRIAVARISKWLERLILPGQDILVDAPHLVARYPSLLIERETKDSWNKTNRFENVSNLPIDHDTIERYRFKKDYWLSRPAWFWKKLANSSNILEVKEPWKRGTTKFQFCEDSSTFEESENCREFRAEVNSVYVQRYVNSPLIEGVEYQPKVRLM